MLAVIQMANPDGVSVEYVAGENRQNATFWLLFYCSIRLLRISEVTGSGFSGCRPVRCDMCCHKFGATPYSGKEVAMGGVMA